MLTCSLVCMSLRQLARTLLKLASSVRALLKPYGDTLRGVHSIHRLLQHGNETAPEEKYLSKTNSAKWMEISHTIQKCVLYLVHINTMALE